MKKLLPHLSSFGSFVAPIVVCFALPIGAFATGGSAPSPGTNHPAVTTGPNTFSKAALQTPRELFRKNFLAAAKLNSKKEMEKLMRKNADEAVYWIIELAYGMKLAPSDTKTETFDALANTWKRARRTDFPAEMHRFYDHFEKDDFKPYNEMVKRFQKLENAYFEEMNKEDGFEPATMITFAKRFDAMGEEFLGIHCDYYASKCFAFAGVTYDKDRAIDLVDLKAACLAYGRMVETRERMGLKDTVYVQGKPRYMELVKKGHGPDGVIPEEAGSGKPRAGGPAARATDDPGLGMVVPLTFELLKEIDAYARPNYFSDEHYAIWHSFFLRETGSELSQVLRFAKLWALSGNPIPARREGAAKIYLDMDGDRERSDADIEIPIKGKLSPVHVKFEIEGKQRDSAFWVQTGQEKDQYQGMETNLAGNDDQYGVYCTPGGTMVGELGGQTIRIIDEDMDGVYGGPALAYGHVGMTKGQNHWEYDSMVIGSSKKAIPFSRYIKVKKNWFDVKSIEDGTALEVLPANPIVGSLKLKFKGPKPAWLVVRGKGSLSDAYFDVASGTVEVPTGEYELLSGMISKGKKLQLQKILICKGAETPTWSVEEGKTTEIVLGGPFGFDFKADVDPKGCQVIGTEVAVIGVSGERYERPYLCVSKPLGSARIPGSKKGTKAVKLPPTMDTMEVAAKGWSVTWFPRDLAIDVKGVKDSIEVQLTEKKHALFGKITSEWLTF